MKHLMSMLLLGALPAVATTPGLLYWGVGADNEIPFAYAQIVQIPSGGTVQDKQALAVVDATGTSLGSAVWAEGFDPSTGTLGLTTSAAWSAIDMDAGGLYLLELYGLEGQVAWSQLATASDLEAFIKSDVTSQVAIPWTPQVVPEPCSGLLLLLGGALLGLRRKTVSSVLAR